MNCIESVYFGGVANISKSKYINKTNMDLVDQSLMQTVKLNFERKKRERHLIRINWFVNIRQVTCFSHTNPATDTDFPLTI